uniref:Uncharacterized protein n=1 Tax=Opuntia streptacantha TaxID=393608 RepID=A0A7C9CSR9_OPUST
MVMIIQALCPAVFLSATQLRKEMRGRQRRGWGEPRPPRHAQQSTNRAGAKQHCKKEGLRCDLPRCSRIRWRSPRIHRSKQAGLDNSPRRPRGKSTGRFTHPA